MVEIYINNQLIDLSGDESIEADYSIFDISKIGSRTGARSYSFEVPKTNRNRTIFESPEVVNNLSILPYRKLRCFVLVDGTDVGMRFAEIESGYNLRVYGGNTDWFEPLKDLKCGDLDLIEWNHFWQHLPMVLSRINTEGYIYALIDYHLDSPNGFINNDNGVVREDYIMPCIFYKTVLEAIYLNTGYTFIDTTSSETENLLLAWFGNRQRDTNPARYEAELESTDTFAIHDVANGGATVLTFQNIISQGANYFVAPLTADKIYFADEVSLTATISLRITSVGTPGVFNDCILTYGYTNRETISGGGVGTGQITFSVQEGVTDDYVISIDFAIKQALTDGYVYLEFFLVAPFGLNGFFTLETGSTIEFSEVVIDSPLNFIYNPVIDNTFDYITPASIIPQVTQMELVKNYMQMFGLIPTTNKIDRTVTLIKFDDILSNVGSAYDWSDKIDFTNEDEIKFILSEYGQKNTFKYKQDGEEKKPKNTDGEINIDNANLELEKEAVELIFAGTNPKSLCLNEPVPNIGIFKNGEYEDAREPRVLNLRIKEGQVYYTNLVDISMITDIPLPYFIEQGQTLNLGFSDNLLTSYYDLLSNILNRVKMMSVEIRLSASDINGLDFSKPVYISHFESFFYISAVKGFSFTESRSTTVELVKLNIHG